MIERIKVLLYIIRECFVNIVGYKMKIRRLFKRSRINNVAGNVDVDIKDKGLKHYKLVQKIISDLSLDPKKNRFVEMGPGGTLLNGFTTVLNGWDEYIAVDVFPSQVWSSYPMTLYDKYVEIVEPEKKRALKELIRNSKRFDGRVKYFGTQGLFNNDFKRLVKPLSVDLIYSWGVLEHVVSPKFVFKENYNILDKDGVVIHVVDTHPHTWSRFNNPLWYLTIPEWLWNVMYGGRGFINRFQPQNYIDWAKESGFNVQVYNEEVDDYDINSIRKRFLDRFRDLPDKELLTHRIYLVLTKK
ncbi:class I SAM-dependent methyltransferase [Candidatus Thioglobus sp.]|nr:class I SAM-dependent methyltransferase [Candidatus Thioglobus sp.]